MGAKLATVAMTILVVSAMFVWFGLFIGDIDTNYIQTGISSPDPINESYTEGFNKASELNSTLDSIRTGFLDNFKEEGTWSLFESIVAIPAVILALPEIILNMIGLAVTMFTSITKLIGIPSSIIYIGMLGIGIWSLFKIIEMWRRYDA